MGSCHGRLSSAAAVGVYSFPARLRQSATPPAESTVRAGSDSLACTQMSTACFARSHSNGHARLRMKFTQKLDSIVGTKTIVGWTHDANAPSFPLACATLTLTFPNRAPHRAPFPASLGATDLLKQNLALPQRRSQGETAPHPSSSQPLSTWRARSVRRCEIRSLAAA